MDSKALARIAAVVFVAVALAAAAVQMSREDERPAPTTPAALQPPVDPLRQGQRQCQQMGEAAARDEGCLQIWSETRDRFLGRSTAPASAGETPDADPLPLLRDEKAL